MTRLTILPEAAYFADIVAAAKASKSGDRLALATMAFDLVSTPVQKLMDALRAAAARGVNVSLLVDAHAFMYDHHDQLTGPLPKSRHLGGSTNQEFVAKYAALEAIAAAGGTYCVTNRPASRFTLPVAGRSHIKAFIHNDTLYLGGCNLGHIEQQDWMVRLQDKKAADWLYDLLVKAVASKNVQQSLRSTDREFVIDEQTTLLLDAGKRGQSIIVQSALKLIDEARENLVITCQFFPNGATARHLAAAVHRGVKVTVYYNHPSKQTGGLALVQQAVLLGEKLHLPPILFSRQLSASSQRIHAKIIASEKAAMIGSHNYVSLGVRLGTSEIALRSTDAAFARKLAAAVNQRLQA